MVGLSKKPINGNKLKAGFTAIELLMVVAILSIVAILAVRSGENFSHLLKSGATLESQSAAKSALFFIEKEIRGARSIDTRFTTGTSLIIRLFDPVNPDDPTLFRNVRYELVPQAGNPAEADLVRTELTQDMANVISRNVLLQNIRFPTTPAEAFFTPDPAGRPSITINFLLRRDSERGARVRFQPYTSTVELRSRIIENF